MACGMVQHGDVTERQLIEVNRGLLFFIFSAPSWLFTIRGGSYNQLPHEILARDRAVNSVSPLRSS